MPPKLETYISPLGLTHRPLALSLSVLATWHRWRSWSFGRKPSGTVSMNVEPHDPEILAVMLYMFMTTIPPTRQKLMEPVPTVLRT